jgi:hypothetical protein
MVGKVAFWGDDSGDCGYTPGAHNPALTNQIEKWIARETRIVRAPETLLRAIGAIRFDPEPDCCTFSSSQNSLGVVTFGSKFATLGSKIAVAQHLCLLSATRKPLSRGASHETSVFVASISPASNSSPYNKFTRPQ